METLLTIIFYILIFLSGVNFFITDKKHLMMKKIILCIFVITMVFILSIFCLVILSNAYYTISDKVNNLILLKLIRISLDLFIYIGLVIINIFIVMYNRKQFNQD